MLTKDMCDFNEQGSLWNMSWDRVQNGTHGKQKKRCQGRSKRDQRRYHRHSSERLDSMHSLLWWNIIVAFLVYGSLSLSLSHTHTHTHTHTCCSEIEIQPFFTYLFVSVKFYIRRIHLDIDKERCLDWD